MNQLQFSLAGIPFVLKSVDESAPRLPGVYERFLTGQTDTSDAIYQVNEQNPERIAPVFDSALLWTCETWRMGTTQTDRLAIEIHNALTNTWIPVANVSRDFKEGLILQRAGRQGLPAEYSLSYPIDQVLLTNRIVQHQAGLVHASTVEYDGFGYLFAGPADVGKTTMARHWLQHGATLLNDDRNIIRIDQANTVTVSASPWHGDLTEVNNRSLPLKAIFHLQQANVHHITPLDELNATGKLVATSVAPFYLKENMEKLLRTWTHVCELVPSYTLESYPSSSVVTFVRQSGYLQQ